MHDVFLNYSAKDKEIGHALAEHLKTGGLRAWLNALGIQQQNSIQQRWEKSCTLLMCMLHACFSLEWGKLKCHTLFYSDPTNTQRRFILLLIENRTLPDISTGFDLELSKSLNKAYTKLLKACHSSEAEILLLLIRREQIAQNQGLRRDHSCNEVDATPSRKIVSSISICDRTQICQFRSRPKNQRSNGQFNPKSVGWETFA
jgi:hypothetical protein